jgi:Skp family chaperone for outer membrane proteins
MTETAQGVSPAESEVSTADALAEAANAFKTFNPDATESAERLRDEHGRFVSTKEEIEAEAEAQEGEAEAESHDEEIADEAAEEAQPEPVDLPTSWPAELAEEWQNLPATLQDTIVRREAEREAAVNAKFQEAANVRKANEALISEANTNRQKFAEYADLVLSMVQPQRPSHTMLDPRSADYNPDAYHLQNAQFQQTAEFIDSVKQQRDDALAQQQKELSEAEAQYVAQVEEKFRPALLKDVPELSDPAKQPQVLNQLIQYAVKSGIGEHVFSDPEIAGRITSPELHMAWKAMKYDEMMSAKAKVTPKAPKPAAPPVRPGVATPRSAIQATEKKKAFERLDREGSVEAAAAIFKLQSQGKL